MLRKVGLAIAYFIAGLYVLAILLPALYCLRQDAGDRVSWMLFCPPSVLLRLARWLRSSHYATRYNRSEKDNRGHGFSGRWQFSSRWFCWLRLLLSGGSFMRPHFIVSFGH